jgi:hypothetical protein
MFRSFLELHQFPQMRLLILFSLIASVGADLDSRRQTTRIYQENLGIVTVEEHCSFILGTKLKTDSYFMLNIVIRSLLHEWH